MNDVRIDKWLWAARFYKTRGLAQEALDKGRVRIGGERVKPARGVKPSELVQLEVGEWEREVRVLGLSDSRGPAPVAQALYEDTQASVESRDKAKARRALFIEPAEMIKGRPTKRERRQLDTAKDLDELR